MINNLESLFSSCAQPVIGIEGEKILFMNPTFRALFKSFEVGQNTNNFIPKSLFSNCDSSFSLSTELQGIPVTVSASKIDSIDIYFVNPHKNLDQESSNFVKRLCTELSDNLSVLSLASNMLSASIEQLDRPDLSNKMAIILQTYYKLSRINQNLTSYSDLSDGSVKAKLKNTDIVSLISGMISTISVLISNLSVNISFTCNEYSHVLALDTVLFDQMFLGLVSNSLKNTRNGGEILVSLSFNNKNAIIKVSDSGGGMRSDKLLTSFESYLSPKSTTDIYEGTGTGISLAASIARLHGGSLLLESREDKGTNAIITLLDKTVKSDLVREDVVKAQSVGIHEIYTHLSDVLPLDAYSSKFLD